MNLKVRRAWLLVAAPVVIAVSAAGYTLADRNDQQSLTARQAEIAAKGRQVMPFDLDRTTHRFIKNAGGGIQSVAADDPADTQQITLIREHLTEETAAFTKGDYGDPSSIHGGQMPGLLELEHGHTRIGIRYAQTPSGAQITYTTSDSSLVNALHAWFDAQVTDHGRHAEHG